MGKNKIENQKIMHVKKKDKIRIDIQFKDGSKSDLTFTHDGITLTESNQEGIQITFSNDIATLTIDNAEEKHSGLYQCIMKTEGGEARCSELSSRIEGKKKTISILKKKDYILYSLY